MSPPHASTADADPILSWIGELLCPAGSGLRVLRDPSRGTPSVARWLALPSAGRPRLLAPMTGAPAAAALGQFNDSMTQSARLRKWAVGQALRLGAGNLRRPHHVVLAGHPQRSDDDLLGAVLPEMVGEPLVTAVMLGGARRPNTKPVLQLLRPDGRVLGYAKVGWNDLTRELLVNEHRALTSWEARPPTTFEVPRALGSTTWNGLSILVVSPMPHHVLRSGPRNAPPPTPTARELAAHDGIEEVELANVPFVARLHADTDNLVDEPIRDAARAAISSTIEQHGTRKIAVGTAHGDWGPWNMSRVGGRLHIWDWERMAAGVPIGTDILHLHFQASSFGSRSPVRAASSSALAAAHGQLVELGVDARIHRSLLDLYLVERLLRLAAGRSQGVPIKQELVSEMIGMLPGRGGWR